MSILDELVRVYALTPVADIGSDPAYVKLCARHANDLTFDRERQHVEEAKLRVELSLDKADGIADQVSRAIRMLLQRRRSHDRDLFYDLIVAGYRNRPGYWSAKQQEHFDIAWKLIRSKHDFFLSFTSRYEDVAGDNPINTRYEHFLRAVLSHDYYEKADRKKNNLLATAIHRLLSDPQHIGFFFPHTQGDNEDVTPKLAEACAGSLVFVQLVQNALFVEPKPSKEKPKKENYCYFEYRKALEVFESMCDGRMHVVFIGGEEAYEKLVKPFLVPPAYESWYKHASEKDVPYLEGLHKFDPDKVEALRQVVLTKIKPRIEGVWERVLETVPSS